MTTNFFNNSAEIVNINYNRKTPVQSHYLPCESKCKCNHINDVTLVDSFQQRFFQINIAAVALHVINL